MKKVIAFLLIVITVISCSACARKTKPAFTIKQESVKTIAFKRTTYLTDGDVKRKYVQKLVTDKEDVNELIEWIESLKLDKSEPIEVPVENVQYVIVLQGVKDHKLVFMNEYVIYDSEAFTYKNEKQKNEVEEKYNLLNYAQTDTDLGLI